MQNLHYCGGAKNLAENLHNLSFFRPSWCLYFSKLFLYTVPFDDDVGVVSYCEGG